MGLSIEPADFKENKLTTDDYQLDKLGTGIKLNTKTTAQLAAGEILMSETPSVEQFRQIKEDLLSTEGRENFLLSQQMRRDAIVESYKDELGTILADPNMSAEEKNTFVQGVRAAPETFKPSPLDIMVEQAVLADSGPHETEQEHESRLSFLDSIKEVNSHKRAMTAEVNAVRAEKNPDLKSSAVDMAELLVPFAEWIDVDAMYRDLTGNDVGEGAILMGSQREELFKTMEKLPYNKRAEFSEKIIDYVNNHEQIVFADGNDLVALDTLQQMLVDDDYSNTEKWLDNVFSVIEFAGVFKALGKSGKAAKLARKTATHTEVNATSASQLIKDANPEKARGIHTLTAEDESGEAAEALYGASREEAVAKDLLPEPEITEDVAPNKVKHDGPQFEEPRHIREARRRDGNSYLSTTEAERVREKVIDGLENVEGMTPHKESMTIREKKDGSLGISMMYRPMDSGFKTADQAIENAKFAFRHYGLTEENFTLYRRSGEKWIKTTPKLLKARKELREGFTRVKKKIPEDLKEIDYAVGIDYDYRFRPEDLQGYDLLQTGKFLGLPLNVLDRLPPGMVRAGQGSLTQNVLDAASVLSPQIVNPASVAVDKSVGLKKLYVDTFEGFTEGYRKLPKDRRAKMADYIHEANFDGIRFDEVDLRSRGFNDDEISTLRDWRKANDAMFHATNDDMASTLRNKGYRVFTHDDTDTKLIVKPMKRGSVSGRTQYYDPTTNSIKSAGDSGTVDEFYEKGGTYAQLSEPIKVGDEWVDVVRSPETTAEGYLRAIKDDEKVLSYRDGYYPVMYDANFFVTKTMKKADGTTFEKTIASSKTRDDAEQMVKMLKESEPDGSFNYRPDRRADQDRSSSFDEMGWSLGVSSGISAQRVRGARLKDAGVNMHLAGTSNLHDPLEAVATQIQQLSQRVSMRNYLDTTKRRWVENYAKDVGIEPDRTGELRFPSSITSIKKQAGVDDQTVADARTLFNYIYSLENGYINGIDEGFKATFNFGADLMSKLKWKKGEEALREWGKGSLTSKSKGAVFKMFLAANPQRQLIIQAHQAVQLNAINPRYTTGPDGMAWDLYRLGRAMRGYKGDKEAVEMLEELKNSGMMEAVDANNLVRQDTLHLADLSWSQKAGSIADKPLKWSQKLGFDTAEQFVLVSSWLAHRDMALKAGQKLNRRTYDEIAGQARAFTYNMNRAGDMPYNQNTLNVIAQFLQVPHKAMLQPLLNKSLTGRQRSQLLAWNTAMYGVPTGTLTFLYNNMEDSPQRDALEHGLEDVLLNEVLSRVTGEEQQIDWSDLAPSDLHGMGEFVVGLWTTDVGKMLTESPAGSLIAGANPRLKNLFNTTARWVHLQDDYDDPELDTKYSDVAIAAANLFSGFSNTFKAKYAYETGTKLSSLGNLSDADVTKTEAALQFFGFRTKTETGSRRINELIYGNQNFDAGPGGDVDKWYNELKRQLARKGMTVKERDMAQRILTEGMRVFEDDPVKFQDRLYSLIKGDVEENQYDLIGKIINQTGWRTKSEVREMIEALPDSPIKNQLRENLNRLGEEE